ncbi:unnamed protein product, partial [Mesorhabditis spiculigera]
MDNDAQKPKPYKRATEQRVFVNRSLRLEKIKFFGFDMDYTLAEYKSPQMEILAFEMTLEKLTKVGYPKDILNFKYDPIFPVRGLWFDYLYGNLLKVDGFGSILMGMHGLRFLKTQEIEELYPNKFIQLSESRIFVLNTLFNLPETHLIAQLIDYFDKHADFKQNAEKTGIRGGEMMMSYKSIFQDLRNAVDWVHMNSAMKRTIMDDLEKYVKKDARLPQMLKGMRDSGRKTFLLTNSDYEYTNAVMTYLLGAEWTSFFNLNIVDARKPNFFAEGTTFREVDPETGALKLGSNTGPLKEGVIYSGGSCEAFRKMVKARGKDVLYVGDHIFGDVLRSKKTRGWRTFLIVPELDQELSVWTERRPLFEELGGLDNQLADIYKNLDASATDKPEIHSVLQSIRKICHEMDQEYGVLGSLFRSGSRTTFFASQVMRYADIYASTCLNLVHYPNFYFFRAPMQLMPHESTVDHASVLKTEKAEKFRRQDSIGHQVRGWSKKTATENEFFPEEEEEDVSNESSDIDELHSARRGSQKSPSADVENNVCDTDVVSMPPAQVDRDHLVRQSSD